MKNKIFGSLIVLAVAAVSAWNVNYNSQANRMSDITLLNVEALAEENDANGKGAEREREIKETYYREFKGKTQYCIEITKECIGSGNVVCNESYFLSCS